MKKSKVVKLEQLPQKEGQKYPAFNIEFEDGTKGFTMSKFVLGQEMEYIEEHVPTKSDPSKTYVRIKRPQVEQKGYVKDTIGTIISTGTSYCVELFLHPDLLFWEMKLNEIIEVILPPMIQKHAEAVTSREKEFISYSMRYAINVYENKNQRERFQKAMKLDGKDKEKELNLIVTIFKNILKNMLDVNKGITN
jgi:hypothetical protein